MYTKLVIMIYLLVSQHIVTVMREALVQYEDLKIKSMGKLTIYTVETIFSLAKPKVK